VDLTSIRYQEVSLTGLFGHGIEEWDGIRQSIFELSTDLLLIKELLIEGLITHRFPLKHRRMAVRTAKDKRSGAIKVILDFGLKT
jgi:threonine dehydrogenase-like Zn-dependent dehydrogenase